MSPLEVFGWAGSALLVVSILQRRMRVFRWLNLIASAVLVAYNAALGVWPMAAMNGSIVLIDLFYIAQLARKERTTAKEFNHAD